MWKVCRALLAQYWIPRSLRSRYQQFCKTKMAEEEPAAKRPRTEEGEDGCTELAGDTGGVGAAAETEEGEEAVEEGKEEGIEGGKVLRIKRRKCALLLSYNGKGYLGMQINPGYKTIESDLLEALAKVDAIPESMKFDVGKLQFQRCSRTDKGVSAARQVVSLKHMSPVESVIEPANQLLPPQIRIMGFRRVTKSFNSKNACTSRSYEYLMPTYAFAPYRLTTLDYRIDEETLSKVGRLLQLYEKSHNFHNFTSGKKFEEQSSNRYIISFKCGTPFLATWGEHGEQSTTDAGFHGGEAEKRSEGTSGCEAKEGLEGKDEEDLMVADSVERVERSGSAEEEKDNSMDVAVEREESWRNKEVEFVTLQVKGQSFMIHQIRKMIGLVIAIVRGFTPESTLVEAFGRKKIDIPRAPSLGLLLDNVFFDGYNRRFASDGTRQPLDWAECEEKVQAFKRKHIYQSMIDTEISQKSMMQWLGSLQIHEFHQTQHRLEVAQAQKNVDMEKKKEEDERREGQKKVEQEKREQDDVEGMTNTAGTDQSHGATSSTLSAGKVAVSQEGGEDCHSSTD